MTRKGQISVQLPTLQQAVERRKQAKAETRPDEPYSPSPHQLGSYYNRVVVLLKLLPHDYLLSLITYIHILLGESENDL